MGAMNSEKFEKICDGVWRDRAAILTGCDNLRGEAALMRAVYWRLCNAGGTPGKDIVDSDPEHMLLIYQRLVGGTLTQCSRPRFDSAPFLKELVRRYMLEVGQSG
ncbi:MAG: hypothetical protein QOH63_3134 [Acidobacteriota bacterium]|jgi:hypothetical protein|nr:hypothetical protein [Acidobacteriota bacterium]MDT5062675.1 hypothetical protein [Acidobacteriota bacterium]